MEGEGSEPGLASKEPSFSSYCSNAAETAARVSMEEQQHRLDYDFEFDWLSESDNNVFPVFNNAALLLEKQVKVEATKKDNVSPPSLDLKKQEGAHQTVHYKKSNSIGSSSRRWSFTRFLRRSNRELGAPTRTNNNTEEEKKGGEKLGRDGFIHNMCPCAPILEEADEKELVVMETKISSNSSSTLSDGSNKSVFPVPDPEVVPLDKSEHDHVEMMKEQADSTTSDVDKLEGVKYKKSKSTGTLSKRWSLKGLLTRSSSERGPSRSTNNTEEGVDNTSVFSRCFSLPSRSSSKVSTNLEEGEKYKKSKSTGTLSTRWSFKGFLRRSSSECGTPRSSTNNTKEGVENTGFSRCFSLPSRSSSKLVETLEEGEKYKKSKSAGTLSARWSFKGFLRRSSSDRGLSRSTNNTEEGMKNIVISRCFSLPSRSSSKVSTNLEEGQKLGSDGCIFYLCPCLLSPPADCTQPPKEAAADQEKVVVKEKKPSSRCSTGSDHESKNNNHALGKVDGFSKRPKLQNNAHKVYLKKNTESPYRQEAHNKVYLKKNSASPYRQEAIGFFAMVRPLVMLFTT